jgi:hypothetical protein
MMAPGTVTDLIGIGAIAAITIIQYLISKRSKTPAEPAAA